MARKKLERKVKQIIIHVENIKEIIPLDSDEKPDIPKEQQKSKIEKMKKEIKKIHNHFYDVSQDKTNKTSILQSNLIMKSIPCIQITENKTIKGNNIIHQTSKINENDIGNLKSVSNIFIENFEKEQDDFFNDYLYDLF